MQNFKTADYKIRRQTSRYWRILLTAMAQEFIADKQLADNQAVMHRIGLGFAKQVALPSCEHLTDFVTALNSVWQDMDWGWVDLEETPTALRIVHHQSTNGCLTSAVFGADTEAWAAAFLGGAYQEWLCSLGGGKAMKVHQTLEVDEFGTVEYSLSP